MKNKNMLVFVSASIKSNELKKESSTVFSMITHSKVERNIISFFKRFFSDLMFLTVSLTCV